MGGIGWQLEGGIRWQLEGGDGWQLQCGVPYSSLYVSAIIFIFLMRCHICMSLAVKHFSNYINQLC